jgi:predicted nucleic acid-binding protein
VTVFVDTNVLVYAHDVAVPDKATAAIRVLTDLWTDGTVEAALLAGADTLLTEDLQHGRRFGDLTVSNPFR